MKISNHKYFIGSGDKHRNKSRAIANAMVIELLPYGVEVDSLLLDRISCNKKKVAMEFCTNVLKDYTIGTLNRPLFNNWESRTEFSFSQRVVQILGYAIQLSGNDLEDPDFMRRLLKNVNFKKEKQIVLATTDEAREHFITLSQSKVALDRKQLDSLVGLAREFFLEIYTMKRIYSDEVRISVLLPMAEEFGLYAALKAIKCVPADVLRYAAALTDIKTANLPSDVIYAPLSWKQRTDLLAFLDQFPYDTLFEATGINREAWTRFYRHIHLFNQKNFVNRFPVIGLVSRVSMGYKEDTIPFRYSKVVEAMLKDGTVESTSSDNLVYRTFASRVKSAIESKDYTNIAKLMDANGGYLLRNLATVANGIKKNYEASFIALVRSKLSTATPNVLFSILGINVNAKYRVIDIKGNTVIEEASYPKFIAEIQGDIKRELYNRYGFPGKVGVSKQLVDKVVPFLSRNSELDRGSKIKVHNDRYLYMFVQWIQSHKTRTDLDLSVISIDDRGQSSVVYFGNQVNSYITHSGDITNAPAPHGATEYVRIDIKNLPKNVKHILPIINVYTGDVFSDNEQAYAGFMVSNSETFDIKRDHIRYDLTEPANSNTPFMFDVDNQEIMILDYNNRVRQGLTAHAEVDTIKKLISASTDKTVITIGLLAEMLSGEANELSLSIKKTAEKENEIEPANLSKLFNI